MDIPHGSLPSLRSDSSDLTIQSSPSDLTSSSPLSLKKTNSSPILSSLTHIYNNLRSNEKNEPGLSGTKTNFLKKMLSGPKSSDELLAPSSPPRRSIDGLSYDRADSLSPEPDTSGIETDLQDLDLNSSFFKSMDSVKIPSVFLKDGLPLLKVSHKSRKRIYFRLDISNLKFIWKSALTSASMLASTGRILMPNAPVLSKSKVYEFSIDDIKNLSYQQDASNYREELHVSKEFENQWLSIIYYDNKKHKLKSLHIIADTEHDFKKLVVLIDTTKTLKEELTKNFLFDADIKKNILINKAEDENNRNIKQVLTFNDILKYLKRLNININSKILKDAFNKISLSSEEASDGLNFEQFREFVSILKRRDDINSIFKDICFPGRNYMTLSDFKRFLVDVQFENQPDDYIAKVFKKFSVTSKDYWLQENFNNYLLSKYSSPFNYVNNDSSYFSYPLNEYFISSSHNTYLLGRQVAGDSSIEGYIKALQRGCRCVEIDIWDGNSEDAVTGVVTSEPIVSHGRTFTTEISFSNVIKTIKKHAFITSPFPLIISLEVNCSAENQLKMVQILCDILGDTLVLAPINAFDELPSPLELKHRILVKAKKTSPFNNLIYTENGNYVSASSTSTTTSFSEDNGSVSHRRNSFSIRSKNKSTKIIDEISDLGIYLQGIKFRNFSLPESKTYNHTFSLSEKSLNSMLKDEVKRGSVDKHNRKYFMRVYPSKMRLRSSNFMPITYWSHGLQMVATNWQTYDLGQQINEAMFEVVNKRGYVLKPHSLRKPLLKSKKILPTKMYKTRFSITIISGHQLPKPKNSELAINPFISFEILGASDIIWDQESCLQRTKIVAENGFNPVWNAKFSGHIVADHELVFFRLLVNTSNSVYEELETNNIGILVVRLADMNRGYRYFPIYDLSGEELIYSSLFLKIDYGTE